MSDTMQKPTKEEIEKIKSRLIFLKDKSKPLGKFSVLVYILACIVLVIFNQTEYIVTVAALSLLHGMAFIDRYSGFKSEYRAIEKEKRS